MITLPLVWLVSVLTTIAAFALAQDTRMPFQARLFLCVFLLTLASIGLLLGLRLSFDVPWAAWLQPVVAVMVAPSAYLGFSALTQDLGLNWRKRLLLSAAPVAVAQLAILANLWLCLYFKLVKKYVLSPAMRLKLLTFKLLVLKCSLVILPMVLC